MAFIERILSAYNILGTRNKQTTHAHYALVNLHIKQTEDDRLLQHLQQIFKSDFSSAFLNRHFLVAIYNRLQALNDNYSSTSSS